MVSIFAKTRICRGNTHVHLQFFCKSNFSRHRKAELLRKWIALVLQVKFRFMGCLVKANALVLGKIALSLSSQQIFFRQYFCELLENSSGASKYVPKSFRKFTNINPWRSLMLVKLQAFTEATTGCVL